MDLDRFDAYNRHTEDMVAFMLERLTEDGVLARAMRYPRLWKVAVNVGPVRRTISDYRAAAHRVMDSDPGAVQQFWMLAARFHAFHLRQWIGVYKDREGFNPAWLRAPGHEGPLNENDPRDD